jgi:Na+-driven multidrug efflux pump
MGMAVASIRASATAYLFAAADISFWGIFQGSGRPVYGMAAQILRTLVVRIPSAAALSRLFGLSGVWWCQPLSALASFLLSTFFIFKVMEKIREEIRSGYGGD